VRPGTLVDTGPLVALIDRRDRYHTWVRSILAEVPSPLQTCEAVLSEACFLLRHLPGGPQALFELVTQGLVAIPFSLRDEAGAIQSLLAKYSNVPMSLADACLVRMSEINPRGVLLTVDSDFTIYRRDRHSPIPALLPDDL